MGVYEVLDEIIQEIKTKEYDMDNGNPIVFINKIAGSIGMKYGEDAYLNAIDTLIKAYFDGAENLSSMYRNVIMAGNFTDDVVVLIRQMQSLEISGNIPNDMELKIRPKVYD